VKSTHPVGVAEVSQEQLEQLAREGGGRLAGEMNRRAQVKRDANDRAHQDLIAQIDTLTAEALSNGHQPARRANARLDTAAIYRTRNVAPSLRIVSRETQPTRSRTFGDIARTVYGSSARGDAA
jgi:hypothetical protein